MKRLRTVTPAMPVEIAKRDGLSYSLWIADGARGGVVILHGAGSCKESHHDYARAALAAGFAVIAFDQRGHGASDGPMDATALADVALMAALLREGCGDQSLPLALRGSSMGGYLAILAAPLARADVVVAICPASAAGLKRGIVAGALDFDADIPALTEFLDGHDLQAAVGRLEMPLLLMHAEGDEQVPVEHSRELAELVRHPRSRLIALPGGHHRSIQHDPELQAVSLRFIERVLGLGS